MRTETKYYIVVAIINIIYIFISCYCIGEFYQDSSKFFSGMFIFIFGLLCQKLTTSLGQTKTHKIINIIDSIIVGALLVDFLIVFFGILGFFVLKINGDNISIIPNPNNYTFIKVDISQKIIITFSFWVTIFFSIIQLINANPLPDKTEVK